MKTSTYIAAAAAVALAVGAAPAQAAEVLFASVGTGTSNVSNLDWTPDGAGGSLFTTSTGTADTAGAAAVRFTFSDPALPDFDGLRAAFTLGATVTDTPSQFDGSTFTQTGIDNGRFSFIYTGQSETLDGVRLVQNVTNLLSGIFNNAWIQGIGGVGGLVVSVANGGSAHFTSDIFNPPGVISGTDEFTLHLGNVAPNFGASNPSTGCSIAGCATVGTTSLNSFRAHVGGDFQEQLIGVPEPASWALMILGFGGAGAMLRRRRRVAALAI